MRETDVVVNSIPGDARFVNYGGIDWKGATIVPEELKKVGDAVSIVTENVKSVASSAGADLVVLISPDAGVLRKSSAFYESAWRYRACARRQGVVCHVTVYQMTS